MVTNYICLDCGKTTPWFPCVHCGKTSDYHIKTPLVPTFHTTDGYKWTDKEKEKIEKVIG